MKKIGSIVLCLIMVIGSCGCQRKVDYDLTISVPYTSDYLKKTVELFEKEKDVKVNLQVYEGDKSDGESVDKYVNAMSAEILSGNGSDVICLTGLPYKKYIQLGALMPLDTIVDENQSTLYNKNVLEVCKVDGGLFFMPITYSVPALLVQTDAEEVDFYDTQTWEGFMENATEDLAENHYAIGQVDGQRLLSYAVGSDYSPYIDRESNQGNFSGDDFRELVMLCDKAVKKEQFVYTDNKYDEAVNKGQIKYVYDVFYSFHGLMDTCKSFDGKRRIQTLPHVGDGQGERFFSNDLYGINSKSEKQQLAGEFLKYMTSTDIQKNGRDNRISDQ